MESGNISPPPKGTTDDSCSNVEGSESTGFFRRYGYSAIPPNAEQKGDNSILRRSGCQFSREPGPERTSAKLLSLYASHPIVD